MRCLGDLPRRHAQCHLRTAVQNDIFPVPGQHRCESGSCGAVYPTLRSACCRADGVERHAGKIAHRHRPARRIPRSRPPHCSSAAPFAPRLAGCSQSPVRRSIGAGKLRCFSPPARCRPWSPPPGRSPPAPCRRHCSQDPRRRLHRPPPRAPPPPCMPPPPPAPAIRSSEPGARRHGRRRRNRPHHRLDRHLMPILQHGVIESKRHMRIMVVVGLRLHIRDVPHQLRSLRQLRAVGQSRFGCGLRDHFVAHLRILASIFFASSAEMRVALNCRCRGGPRRAPLRSPYFAGWASVRLRASPPRSSPQSPSMPISAFIFIFFTSNWPHSPRGRFLRRRLRRITMREWLLHRLGVNPAPSTLRDYGRSPAQVPPILSRGAAMEA